MPRPAIFMEGGVITSSISLTHRGMSTRKDPAPVRRCAQLCSTSAAVVSVIQKLHDEDAEGRLRLEGAVIQAMHLAG